MSTITSQCRTCGTEFTPDRRAIVKGAWRDCPACRPAPSSPGDPGTTRCERCGRALRTKGRTICLTCLGLSPL
jgi:hypothetical protein